VLLSLAAILGCTDNSPFEVGSRATDPERPAFASSPNVIAYIPISFTLTPDACPALATTVTGEGILKIVEHFSTSADGAAHFSHHENFEGAAAGADGSAYKFNYNLNIKTTTEPEPPFVLSGVDNFHLIGQGSTPDIGGQILFLFRVNEDGSITDLGSRARGAPPECDPI
jgi:hypothetical protein